MKKKLTKKLTSSQAKKKAWTVFSQYIRQKYALPDGQCQCVTCDKWDHWKNLHAGHFIDGRNNSVLYNEKLVHPQCFHCNSKRPGCLSGNKVRYTIFMAHKYCLTMEEIEALQNLYFKSKPMKPHEHLEVLEEYKEKLKNI
jgi:hypothetical protein